MPRQNLQLRVVLYDQYRTLRAQELLHSFQRGQFVPLRVDLDEVERPRPWRDEVVEPRDDRELRVLRREPVDPLARAEVRASKTDIRSLADDLAVIRDALDGARDDLTACQRDGLYRDRSTTQLVADVEYRRSGGARKHKLLQSTGSLDLDHCVLSVLDRLEVRLRFRMPVRVEVDLPQPPDEDDELTPLWHEVNRFELDNGLVVMHLPRPGRDARLRLVIGAGSTSQPLPPAFHQAMREAGVAPNVVTYTTLIDACAKRKEVQRAVAIFRDMIADGVPPNRITCTALFHGCLVAGEVVQHSTEMI